MDHPYLSIVAATRNDDHGGDLNRRTSIFINGVVAQANRHKVPTELTLVEWNPPEDRPPLRDAFSWPPANPWCEIRIITVPREVHRQFRLSEKLPFFQMIAKNVGVRRAKAEFVLSTNVDILFSDFLFRLFAERRLEKGVLYRSNRVDVDGGIPAGVSIEQQLAYCRDHVLRVHRRGVTLVVPPLAPTRTVEKAVLIEGIPPELIDEKQRDPIRVVLDRVRHCLTDRRLALQATEDDPRALARSPSSESDAYRAVLLIEYVSRRLLAQFRNLWGHLSGLAYLVLGLLVPFRLLFHDLFVKPRRARKRLRALGYEPNLTELMDELMHPYHPIPDLHTNACGDFLLTDRESWKRMRGGPELSVFSMHLDSLTVLMGYREKIKIVELDPELTHYHIEHGSGWTPEENERLHRRMNERGVRILSFASYLRYGSDLLGRPHYFLSGEDWGLAGLELPEETLTRSEIVRSAGALR